MHSGFAVWGGLFLLQSVAMALWRVGGSAIQIVLLRVPVTVWDRASASDLAHALAHDLAAWVQLAIAGS